MSGTARVARRRAPGALDPHSPTFQAFSDTIYVGVLLFALSIPLVTWFAALTAGVEALRDARAQDRHVRARDVWSAFGHRLRRHALSQMVLPAIVTALLVVDVVLLPYAVPGELWATLLPAVLAAGLGAIALRVAGAWRRGIPTTAVYRTAWRRMSTDAAGSALLVLAVVCAGSIVALAPLLLIVMLGPLALAALAMDRETPETP